MKIRMETDKRLNVARAVYLIYKQDNVLHAGEVYGCSVGESSGKREKVVSTVNNGQPKHLNRSQISTLSSTWQILATTLQQSELSSTRDLAPPN